MKLKVCLVIILIACFTCLESNRHTKTKYLKNHSHNHRSRKFKHDSKGFLAKKLAEAPFNKEIPGVVGVKVQIEDLGNNHLRKTISYEVKEIDQTHRKRDYLNMLQEGSINYFKNVKRTYTNIKDIQANQSDQTISYLPKIYEVKSNEDEKKHLKVEIEMEMFEGATLHDLLKVPADLKWNAKHPELYSDYTYLLLNKDKIVKDILKAVSNLHNVFKTRHYDIKLENIVINKNKEPSIKLIDLDTSFKIGSVEDTSTTLKIHRPFSSDYYPLGPIAHNQKIDEYQVGITTLAIYIGRIFSANECSLGSGTVTEYNAENEKTQSEKTELRQCLKELKEFKDSGKLNQKQFNALSGLLDTDSEKRISVDKALELLA